MLTTNPLKWVKEHANTFNLYNIRIFRRKIDIIRRLIKYHTKQISSWIMTTWKSKVRIAVWRIKSKENRSSWSLEFCSCGKTASRLHTGLEPQTSDCDTGEQLPVWQRSRKQHFSSKLQKLSLKLRCPLLKPPQSSLLKFCWREKFVVAVILILCHWNGLNNYYSRIGRLHISWSGDQLLVNTKTVHLWKILFTWGERAYKS